jgi:hypothetical protein
MTTGILTVDRLTPARAGIVALTVAQSAAAEYYERIVETMLERTWTWGDPAMDAIYDDLRDEFDLVDRHDALEHKLKSVQESLELILDVARDRRLFLLEVSVVALIMLEIVVLPGSGTLTPATAASFIPFASPATR